MPVTTAEWRLFAQLKAPPFPGLRCFIGRTGTNFLTWARFPPPTPPIELRSRGLDTTTRLVVNGDLVRCFNWNVPDSPTIPNNFDTTWFVAFVHDDPIRTYLMLNQVGGFGVPNKIFGGAIDSGSIWGQRRFLNLRLWATWFPPAGGLITPGVGSETPAGTLNFQFLGTRQDEVGGLDETAHMDSLILLDP